MYSFLQIRIVSHDLMSKLNGSLYSSTIEMERIRMGKNLYRAVHVLAIHSFVHLEVTCKTTHVVLTPSSLTHQASRLMEEGASYFTEKI